MPSDVTWDKSRPPGKVSLTYHQALADDKSWTMVGQRIDYPPNGSTPPHKHGGANVVGYVVEGSVLSAMNDREKKVFQKGESWYEPPGCYHRISDNNSTTDPAVITVSYMIRTAVIEEKGVKVLVEVDPEYIDGAKEQMKNWEEKQK